MGSVKRMHPAVWPCRSKLQCGCPSRGLLLELRLPPEPSQEPRLLRDTRSPEPWYVDSQGSYDAALSNGNQLMGFGTVPVIQEYGPMGDLRWEARFGTDFQVMSYRAYKHVWHATPYWEPTLVLDRLTDPCADSGSSTSTFGKQCPANSTDKCKDADFKNARLCCAPLR